MRAIRSERGRTWEDKLRLSEDFRRLSVPCWNGYHQ